MLKKVSYIGAATIIVTIAWIFCCCEYIHAAGTYKLEYPPGYGYCCPPNSMQFGYFRTCWREWPFEARPDKTFPRSIGMEVLPAPAGERIIPTPKIPPKAADSGEGEQPAPGAEGETTPLPEGLPFEESPSAQPSEPGMEVPALPGLPQESEGFNPLPGLPPDLGTPALEPPKEEGGNKPSEETKTETDSKDESSEKAKTETDAPATNSEGAGTQLKFPSNKLQSRRSGPPQNVVRQSYQQAESPDGGAVVGKIESRIDLPAEQMQKNAPPVAFDGFVRWN